MVMTTLAEAFALAVAHHQGGRLPQAEAIYRQILATDPQNAPALHMLGVLAHQTRRGDLAIESIRGAIAIAPAEAIFHNSLGEALRECGKLADSKDCFRKALSLDADLVVAHYNLALAHQSESDWAAAVSAWRQVVERMPQLAVAHNELGNALRQQGEFTQALAHFRRAIECQADYADAYNDLGNLWQDMGNVDEAIACFEQATRLQPGMAAAHYNLGNAWRDRGNNERAADCFRQAIRLQPQFARAHNNLGTALQALGDDEAAARSFAAAIGLEPSLAEAHSNLATLLKKKGVLSAAREHFLRAAQLEPRSAENHFNLGCACQALREWEAARECYREALRIRPTYLEARCNLGSLCTLLGEREGARQHIERALELDADCAEAHCNLGMLLLGEGQHAAGWAEYQWYARSKSYYGSRFSEPAWDGSPLAGRTILIVSDHGLGDTLQFVRYVPWLRHCGAERILLAAQAALWPLLKESGFGELVALDAGTPKFDTHVATVMLPALYYAQQGTIGPSEPYLRAADTLVERWRSRLAKLDGFKIGVCWQGSRDFIWSETRSVPLAQMAPLGELPDVSLVSLQLGEGRQQLAAIADRFRVIDFGEDLDRAEGAFMDTAAIIKNLDLVITSDTSVAHVAGGLGANVWLALSSACDWRWEQQGETTAWYPNMRLFRQPAPGDWRSVFERMASELRRFTS